MTLLYRLLLTLNATSWMVVVYGIKSAWSFFGVPSWIFACILLLIPVALSGFSLIVAKGLGTDSLTECQESSLADNEFLPADLGYFFVSLFVPDNLNGRIIQIPILAVYGIISFGVYFAINYFNGNLNSLIDLKRQLEALNQDEVEIQFDNESEIIKFVDGKIIEIVGPIDPEGAQ